LVDGDGGGGTWAAAKRRNRKNARMVRRCAAVVFGCHSDLARDGSSAEGVVDVVVDVCPFDDAELLVVDCTAVLAATLVSGATLVVNATLATF
jgi:hypothetical protein